MSTPSVAALTAALTALGVAMPVESSSAPVTLLAQLRRPLSTVERLAELALALRNYVYKPSSGSVDRDVATAIELATSTTANHAAAGSGAFASSLGNARVAALHAKLVLTKTGRRTALMNQMRALRMEGLDLYIGKV